MAHAEIHHDDPGAIGDLGALAGRTVAVLGFGNQGAAQAANLRDSGAVSYTHLTLPTNREV